MQHVIHAIEVLGLFDGSDVGGFFHHAYQPLVASSAGAIGARVHIRDVVADGAEAKAGLDLADGRGQGFGIVIA